MTKVTMPEHWAERIAEGSAVDFWWQNGTKGIKVGEKLITTEQAEAYADACVRGALEEAVQICWEMQSRPEYGKDDKDRWLAIAEQRIRALIPKENT